jgi:hypothetical protein
MRSSGAAFFNPHLIVVVASSEECLYLFRRCMTGLAALYYAVVGIPVSPLLGLVGFFINIFIRR